MMPRGLNVTPWGGALCPRVGPLWLLQLALGRCHPAPPSDPRVRGLSPRERGVCGWPQPAAWNAGGPCNEQLSHPKEKQAHLQKPRGARWGLGTGCEGGASWSAFLLSRGGKPGQRGLRAQPLPPRGLSGASGESGLGSTWRKEALGTLCSAEDWLGTSTVQGVWRPLHPRPPDFGASWGPQGVPTHGLSFPHCPAAGVHGLGCSLAGEGVTASQSEPRA